MEPVKHKTLAEKVAEVIPILPPAIFPAPALTQEQLDYIASQVTPGGGSSGILDCGDFNSGNEGIIKIDLGGF
jgi:hypothetical protein